MVSCVPDATGDLPFDVTACEETCTASVLSNGFWLSIWAGAEAPNTVGCKVCAGVDFGVSATTRFGVLITAGFGLSIFGCTGVSSAGICRGLTTGGCGLWTSGRFSVSNMDGFGVLTPAAGG